MQLKKIEKYKNAKGFELLWPKALICEFLNDITRALNLFKDFLKVNPDRKEIYFARSQIFERQKL